MKPLPSWDKWDDYDVLYGVPGGKEAFKIQSYFYEQADVMYQTGKYPDTTELNCVPPMYLQIYNRKKNETLLVGIYDCAGEMLRQASAGHENATAFLTHMSAFIYLVEARRMYGVEMEEESQKQAGTVCRVLSLEEQGQMQEMMASREPVPASSLIKNRSRIVENPWEIYNSVLQVLKGEHVNRHQHMAYSIIKSDEIENRPEIRKIRNWDVLFRNPNAKRALDVNYILEANLVAKEIFRQLVIEGNEEEKTVGWRCWNRIFPTFPGIVSVRLESQRRESPIDILRFVRRILWWAVCWENWKSWNGSERRAGRTDGRNSKIKQRI